MSVVLDFFFGGQGPPYTLLHPWLLLGIWLVLTELFYWLVGDQDWFENHWILDTLFWKSFSIIMGFLIGAGIIGVAASVERIIEIVTFQILKYLVIGLIVAACFVWINGYKFRRTKK